MSVCDIASTFTGDAVHQIHKVRMYELMIQRLSVPMIHSPSKLANQPGAATAEQVHPPFLFLLLSTYLSPTYPAPIHLFILSDLQFGLLLAIFLSSAVSSLDIIPVVMHFHTSFSSLVITLLRRSQSLKLDHNIMNHYHHIPFAVLLLHLHFLYGPQLLLALVTSCKY